MPSVRALDALGRRLKRSNVPGLDPVSAAMLLTRLDPSHQYHYYRFGSKETAARGLVAWLRRSRCPAIAFTLAGQHTVLVIGYELSRSTAPDGIPSIAALLVMDPLRGDLQRATARRRPDKSRSHRFKVGARIPMQAWNSDEWWFAFAWWVWTEDPATSLDRTDGAYALPHWTNQYVVVVADDDDAPSDREGRIVLT